MYVVISSDNILLPKLLKMASQTACSSIQTTEFSSWRKCSKQKLIEKMKVVEEERIKAKLINKAVPKPKFIQINKQFPTSPYK